MWLFMSDEPPYDKECSMTLQGEDYDRIKLLHIEATEAERLERKKKKKNPDPGFADYEQATARCGVVLTVVSSDTLSNFSS
jgi:pre-mRNA-splicing factor SYF2